MEKIEVNYFGYTQPTYKEKIELPTKKTTLPKVILQKFEINQEKAKIDEKYKFIDIDKLLKRGGQKYNISELREIASKIGIPVTNSKPELTRLIKLKIGVE